MKEMTSVASAMMTAEEKEELERELNKQTPTVTPAGEPPSTSTPPDVTTSSSTTPHEPTDGPAHAAIESIPETVPESGPAPGPNSVPTTPTKASRPVSAALPASPGEGPALSQSQSGTSTPKPTTEGRKGKSKLTPEQKQKIDEIAAERDEAMVKRVAELTDKLKERLRPFVEAHEPGGKNDPETLAFEARMKREADDLKLESFGVEVRWLRGPGGLILTTVTTATTHDR
jgi:hypothetical protein